MAGIYTTNSSDACLYVAKDSRANVIVVENQKQLDKILQVTLVYFIFLTWTSSYSMSKLIKTPVCLVR